MATQIAMPSVNELRASLVRVDAIEAWAPRLYLVEALPGYARVVRQAQLLLFRDGRVKYQETIGIGLRLFQRKVWVGRVEDLGKPRPVPFGFEVAKALRLHPQAGSTSFVARIDGRPMILCFTGRMREVELRGWASLVHLIPEVGHLIEGTEVLADRAANLGAGGRAAHAAGIWRSVLDGTRDPASLPLLFARPT